MNRICILFHRLGPYHWARLNAAGAVLPTLALEISGETSDYAWDRVEGRQSFERVTLFPDQDSRKVPGSEVARRVYRTLDEQNPSAVAIPGWSEKSSLAALSWCLKAGRPAIVMSESQSSDETRRWGKEKIKQRIVGLCSSGLAGGTAHVDYLAELGMPPARIFTGYDVVDNHYFATRSDAVRRQAGMARSQGQLPEKYFLASSRFIPKKNLARLLEAFAGYRRSAGRNSWKLVLLGDGPLRPDLLKLREQLGLTEEVLMPGFKQYAELPGYYGLASAFIHASTVEQWGLVVNEAMASGLPVLVSERCGCAPDLVKNGRNGATFNPFNVPQLTDAMLRMAGGEIDLAAQGQASRQIIANWSPEKFASGLQRAVQAALDAGEKKNSLLNSLFFKAVIHH